MGKHFFKLSSNYIDVAKYFLQMPESFCSPIEDDEKLFELIEKDFPRTPYFSRSYSLNDFEDRWKAKDTTRCFTQGNATGEVFTGVFNDLKSLGDDAVRNRIDKKIQLLNKDSNDFLKGWGNCSFAFIDKKGNDCGLSIVYQKEAPEIFTIAFIRHTHKDPGDREVTVFQGTDNEFYPDLEKLCGPAFQMGELVKKSSLKSQLLDIASLPDEVKYFINDIVKDDGQLIIESLDRTRKKLKSGNTNSDIYFAQEQALIKQDLTVYLLFCQELLENIKDHDSIDSFSSMSGRVTELHTQIKAQLENLIDDATVERAELYQEYIHIQKEVISLLKDADISQPYQALLEQLDKQLQYIHQSFWERRNRSILTSSAMTVLAVAALALTITGVMAPISMTIFAVINIVFCFSALLSWGLAITEEVEFKEDRKNLKQDIKTSNNVATLDLYIKHAEDLENTETKKLSHITQSFFHKTVQEMVLTESPKHVSPGQGV